MRTPEQTLAAGSRDRAAERPEPMIDRRRLVGIASAALAAPMTSVAAQQAGGTPETGTPIASPAASVPIGTRDIHAVSAALVGDDGLSEDAVVPLAQLIGANPALLSGLVELVQVENLAANGSLDGLSSDARAAATNILQYWYLGRFDGRPVENRAAIFFGLPVWQTVPYSTQPTLCKAFGYWATDPGVEDDA